MDPKKPNKPNNPVHHINDDVRKHILEILAGSFQQAALGTVSKDNHPMVTKVVPMRYKKDIYLLLSDLSEHSKNLKESCKVSLYYAEEEKHKIKSNNPRLTIQGTLRKMNLNKGENEFQVLLKNYNKIEPGSKMWGMFTDFDFYIFKENRTLYVEGFGKAFEGKIEK